MTPETLLMWQRRMIERLCRQVVSHEDGAILQTSGSTGAAKTYRWGPDFGVHLRFYEEMFSHGQPFTYLQCVISPESRTQLWRRPDGRLVTVILGQGEVADEPIRDHALVCNAELISIHERRHPFLSRAIDRDTCVLCCTGSPLRPDHIDLFNSLGIRWRDHMRCWDGGATFIMCEHGNRHWLDFSAVVSVDEEGHLISTDLWNLAQRHVSHRTGDIITWRRGQRCRCGLPIDEIEFADRPIVFEVGGHILTHKMMADAFRGIGDHTFMCVRHDGEAMEIVSDLSLDDGSIARMREVYGRMRSVTNLFFTHSESPLAGERKVRTVEHGEVKGQVRIK